MFMSAHPRSRSDTICNIVQEVCETVAWIHGSAAANDQELASLHQLLEEAQAHRQRMDTCQAVDVGGQLRAS